MRLFTVDFWCKVKNKNTGIRLGCQITGIWCLGVALSRRNSNVVNSTSRSLEVANSLFFSFDK